MKLTPDAEVEEVLEDSYRQGVKIVKASAPVEDPDYFEEADEYVFTTRSRFARNFTEAGILPQGAEYNPVEGILPQGAEYNPVEHAMRNELEDPALQIEDGQIDAALFVRDQYEANGLEPVNELDIEEEDYIGRFGAYNQEEVGVNPEHFSDDFSAEKREARQIVPEGLKLDYDEIKDPALQPDIQHLSEREGLNTARNVGVAALDDRLLEPAQMEGKQQILDSDLSDLVEDAGQRPEKVGPGNYLAVTEAPVTEEGFYTVLQNPMTAGHQLNSRIGDPEWEEPMVVEFTYPQIVGDLGGVDRDEAFNFPIQLQANYIKKT